MKNYLDELLEELEAEIGSVEGTNLDTNDILEEELSLAMDEAISHLEESLNDEDNIDQQLEEANKIKFDKKTKLKAAITKRAILMGKEANDTLYDKHIKVKKLWEKTEAMLVKKIWC